MPRRPDAPSPLPVPPASALPAHVRVAVVGSGFAGLGTAIRLRQEGVTDFLVFERAEGVGGVWRANTYPGCACDVQSHLYSLSFAREAGWSRSYGPQEEIRRYLEGCVARFDLARHLRFGHEVREVRWLEDDARWRLETSHGVVTADVVVGAMGGLSEPKVPELPGLDRFGGEVFHSAAWNHAYDLRGKRVAVVGTGASAIQFVPHVQPLVGKLVLFQRTPPWVVPRNDRAFGPAERALFRRVPGLARTFRAGLYASRELFALGMMYPELFGGLGERLARAHLRRAVKDPELRRKLTPSYRLGCKRVLLSDDYLPAVAQPNVEVVPHALARAEPGAVVGADGSRHEVDAIVFGTGFQIQDFPFARRVVGRGGASLRDAWAARGTMVAHLGTTVAGFPNLFLLQGPNTGLGHTSVLIMIEAQIEHVVRALRFMAREGAAAIEPRPDAQDAFVRDVDRRMEGTVWTAGGCASWYLDASGRNSTLWPGFTFSFARRVRPFDPAEYLVRQRGRDAMRTSERRPAWSRAYATIARRIDQAMG